MTRGWRSAAHKLAWRLVHAGHHADYAWVLPAMARMPLWLGYLLSHWRGKLNARLARDWRSVALETRHIQRQSMAGYAQLPNPGTEAQRAQWCQQRFATEARDEFEAQLVAARRLHALQCTFLPAGSEILTNNSDRGLVLLTPHFDSFYLGIAFLAQASGKRLNSMSSAVTKDPRVTPAVGLHFDRKYRGLEQYLHGGKVPDMEGGLRPFYRMLERRETLVVLGDAPVLPNGVSMEVDFLGARRMLAGGALRLAQQTGSDLGAFICRYVRPGQYALEICAAGPADDPQTLTRVYAFMGQHIAQDPGLWWASDLLPHMTPVEPIEAKNASAD